MQFSPISGQDTKSVPVTSPDRSLTANPESSTSPRSHTIQLSCRSPNGNTVIGTTLRIGSFYTIESSFTRLQEALKPDRKATRTTTAPALLDQLQAGIKVSTLDAEDAFKVRDYALCRLHLDAAKSNQVAMLGKIDDIEDAEISEDNRTEIRGSCVELGSALTKMLIQAKKMELESTQKQKAHDRDSGSDSDDTTPSLPQQAEPTKTSSLNSPARTRQKRAQGDADSPVLVQSPSKRQKNDTTTSTSTATAKSVGITQSPLPAYRAARQPSIAHDTMTGTSVTSPEKPAGGTSTSTTSPQKMRAISPQPRPRPRSQLFVAPPDFTTIAPVDTTDHSPAAAPARAQAGTAPGPDADRSAQRS